MFYLAIVNKLVGTTVNSIPLFIDLNFIFIEFRESFNLFDKENDNRIHVKDMGTVLRSLGLHPTEAELTDLLGTIETEGKLIR